MSEKAKTFKEITPEMVTAWKSQHPVYHISILLNEDDPINGESAQFYARPLSMSQTYALAEYQSKKSTTTRDIAKTMLASCILGGDMEYLSEDMEDNRVWRAVMEQIGEIQDKKKGTLKKV